MPNWNICEDPYPGPDWPLPALRTVTATKIYLSDEDGNILSEVGVGAPVTMTNGDTMTFTFDQLISNA
jgi:hypothetical protein